MPAFLPVILITVFALVTSIATTIAARDVIWNKNSPKANKLTKAGFVFIIATLCLVILPIIQYFAQASIDAHNEQKRKTEQTGHDEKVRKDYELSVERMRREFDTGNNKTLTVIGQTLAKYGYQLDTTNKQLIRLLHDSGNIKNILPDQPVLAVITDFEGPGIKFLKYENELNHYRINFASQDGASCCFDLKMSAAVLDSSTTTATQMTYKGPVQATLELTDEIAKGAEISWTFTVNNSHPYDWLYVWVRGSYGDRDNKHIYKIDQVYYNRKGANTFGSIGGHDGKIVKELVHRFEKD